MDKQQFYRKYILLMMGNIKPRITYHVTSPASPLNVDGVGRSRRLIHFVTPEAQKHTQSNIEIGSQGVALLHSVRV